MMLLVLLQCVIPVKIPKVNSDQVVKDKGLAQQFYLLCSLCSAATYFYSSSKDRKNAFDINLKLVHASCQGTGLAGITKIAGILDLPPPVTAKAFKEHCQNIEFQANDSKR